jgi:hypothetical protein
MTIFQRSDLRIMRKDFFKRYMINIHLSLVQAVITHNRLTEILLLTSNRNGGQNIY